MNISVLSGDDLAAAIKAGPIPGRRSTLAVAFVSAKEVDLTSGDILVFRGRDDDFTSGASDREVLRAYLRAGVQLYKKENLHAKIYRFHESAIVCSANLSHKALASNPVNVEAGVVLSNPAEDDLSQVDDLLNTILKGLEKLTDADIEAMPKRAKDSTNTHDSEPEEDSGPFLWSIRIQDPATEAEVDAEEEAKQDNAGVERVIFLRKEEHTIHPIEGDLVSVVEKGSDIGVWVHRAPREVIASGVVTNGDDGFESVMVSLAAPNEFFSDLTSGDARRAKLPEPVRGLTSSPEDPVAKSGRDVLDCFR